MIQILSAIVDIILIVVIITNIRQDIKNRKTTKKIDFIKTNELAHVPYNADSGSAGYDLFAATDYETVIDPHSTILVGTGLAMELPEGTFGAIFARSGLAIKRGIRPGNCVGVIDASYRGEIKVGLHNDTDTAVVIGAGERIAQLVLLPYIPMEFNETTVLSDTERGVGGFGSTGTH